MAGLLIPGRNGGRLSVPRRRGSTGQGDPPPRLRPARAGGSSYQPERIEIVSYPGPDASMRREALNGDRIFVRRYRNRRIGKFLKELDLTEGRSTGIPKIRESMRRNGSPPPRFDTDEERTFFLVALPEHPAYLNAHDEAHDEMTETERQILRLLGDGPNSAPEIAHALGYRRRSGHLKKTLDRLPAES